VRFEKLGDTLHPADHEAVEWLTNAREGDVIELRVGTRTSAQNNSLHKWLRDCANALNDAGLDMRVVLDKSADMPWTETALKERVWRPVQEAMTGHHSSADVNKPDYPAISEAIHRHIASRCGFALPPWPTYEDRAA
jgi:hypothetical protein